MTQQSLTESHTPRFDDLPKNRIKGLLLWYLGSSVSASGRQTNLLANLLDELSVMTAEDCFDALEELSIEDLSKFSLLMEFGPEFADRPGYRLLLKCLQQKLAQEKTEPQQAKQ